MTERLLQFIWQFQYFNRGELTTHQGEAIRIVSQGQYNSNQGPDFTSARISINGTVWAGTAEIHIRTSDWKRHHHEQDKNYGNVILHVVWEHDEHINDIPVLILKDRVPARLLGHYTELMTSPSFMPCEKMILQVPEIKRIAWQERLMVERMIRKSASIESLLLQNNYHWEETLWWMLARNFGSKVNGDAFEAMARSIPLKILTRHKSSILQLESLLFGQAGLLGNHAADPYERQLQKEFKFLRYKYQLKPIHHPLHFLRMRPSNFPTIRLAQLAMLIHQSVHLLARIREALSIKEVKNLFGPTAGEYWNHHYRLGEKSGFRLKTVGPSMIESIMINTVIPILFTFGKFHRNEQYQDRAIRWLEELQPENNTITRGFEKTGIENKNAFDSQSLIELMNEYCCARRCLDCAIGNDLLKL